MGFIHLGLLAFDDKKQSLATASVLRHGETSDIAHVMIATKEGHARTAEMVVFSRSRTDGSRIFTLRSTIQSPFPPNPDDSSLRVHGAIPLQDLWGVHTVRVANDATSKVNDSVTDMQHFQTAWESAGARRHIASGFWLLDERPGFLRPTARGALFMCLRMLLPWKQISRIRARMKFHRFLYEFRRRSVSYHA